jgi:hypothetical protein
MNTYTMEQVMNNRDLVRHIYSFGYAKHRIYMKCIVNYFKFNKAIRIVVLKLK